MSIDWLRDLPDNSLQRFRLAAACSPWTVDGLSRALTDQGRYRCPTTTTPERPVTYLDIEQLIFAVGVDRPVIDELVKRHYAALGLAEDKSRQYLSKMFQIEVDLAPSARQIDGYLDDLLDRLPYWSVELDGPQRKIFRDVNLQLARRNEARAPAMQVEVLRQSLPRLEIER